MKLKNKRVLVYGLGKSGIATIKFLLEKKAKVFFYDDDARVFQDFEHEGVTRFVLSFHIAKIDLVIVSPGVYNSHIIRLFDIAEVKIINEIELAYNFVKKGKIIAITGTNGKTTTTTLIKDIFENAGKRTVACGNIGVPFISVIDKDSPDQFFIIELSSFQLERLEKFCPNVSAIINISPDHLNRHKNLENYTKLKFNIAKKQKKDDMCIINSNLSQFEKLTFNNNVKKLFFGNENSAGHLVDDNIYILGKRFCNLSDLGLNKTENIENYLVSIVIARLYGINNEVIISTIKNFKKEPHRIELIGTFNGIKYINDSKATNPASTVFALKAVGTPNLILLLGGEEKNFEFDMIFKQAKKSKHIVCFGSAADKIYKCGKKHKFEEISKVATLRQAVNKANQIAQKGDVVLLSPACASFDEFNNYKDRGAFFKGLVYGENEKKDF